MVRASAFTAVGLFFLALPIHSRAANGPIRIPGPGEGYQITKNETTRPAPDGYEGRTDISTLTAVGNTPRHAQPVPNGSTPCTVPSHGARSGVNRTITRRRLRNAGL